jgi:hypothetical protein
LIVLIAGNTVMSHTCDRTAMTAAVGCCPKIELKFAEVPNAVSNTQRRRASVAEISTTGRFLPADLRIS